MTEQCGKAVSLAWVGMWDMQTALARCQESGEMSYRINRVVVSSVGMANTALVIRGDCSDLNIFFQYGADHLWQMDKVAVAVHCTTFIKSMSIEYNVQHYYIAWFMWISTPCFKKANLTWSLPISFDTGRIKMREGRHHIPSIDHPCRSC